MSKGRKTLAVAATTVVALLVAGSAQPRQHAFGVLAIVGNSSEMAGWDAAYLVRVDSRNLRPIPGQSLQLGPVAAAWAYSPDRSMLAVGIDSPFGVSNCSDVEASLRLVDAATLTAVGDVPLGHVIVDATAWLAPDRAVAVVRDCGGTASELLVVDPTTRTVTGRRSLPDDLASIQSAGSRLVIMTRPAGVIGPARLTVVGAAGSSGNVVVDRIDVGIEPSGHIVWPGLALTPDGRRAFLVSPMGLIGDIDLGSLDVTYHSVVTGRALADMLPPLRGSIRLARVLPTGTLAVTGSDDVTHVDSLGMKKTKHIPAGLAFIDTKYWTGYILDPSIDRFVFASNTLLTTSGSYGVRVVDGDPRAGLLVGQGLGAYSVFGIKRFHLFGRQLTWVSLTYGGRSFVQTDDQGNSPLFKVVDLRRRKVTGTRNESTLPWVLQGRSSVG